MTAQKVLSLGDLVPDTAVRVVVDGVPIAVVLDAQGVVHAIGDTCTHGDVSLSDGFVEGEHSLVADARPIAFRHHDSDTEALAQVAGFPAVQRLAWFNRGFMKAQVRDGQLVLSDLRMGAEPDYSFNFAVAERDGAGWRAIPPQQLAWPWEARRRLGQMWDRIWTEPPAEGGVQ